MDSSTFDYRSLLPTTRYSSSNSDSENESEASSNNSNDTNDNGCCGYEIPIQLTFRERMIGCISCMIGGYILSLGNIVRIYDLLFHNNPYPIVINTTIGNIITLLGSFFFSGPKQQIKKMFYKKRKNATIIYLISLFGTLFIVYIVPGKNGFSKGCIVLLCLLFQYISVTWYCLSYIPYAHETIRTLFLQYYNTIMGRGNSNNENEYDMY